MSEERDLAGLESLERAARRLAIDAGERARQLEAVVRYGERHLRALDDAAVYMADRPPGADFARLGFDEQPCAIDEALSLLHEHVDSTGLNIGSPRFFGFIPSGGLYTGALGDYLAAVTNRYAGAMFAAPGVTRLERMLVRWYADQVGYPPGASGDLTSGGSIAALSAVVAAREAARLRSADFARAVVYVTALTHHSVLKAVRIAGLVEAVVRTVPTDAAQRMDAGALDRCIAEDRAHGLLPWLVVATAGTTDLGSVDPLAAIADIAERHAVWLHVDAAYGGAFVLCASGRTRLAGIERSSSLVMDPHKGLFLPFGSGVLLVRDGHRLQAAFRERGAYMQDFAAVHSGEDESAADYSPELTRPFRGLRLWLPLKIFGLAPFRAALEEKLVLARYFYDRISGQPGIEVGPAPDLSIVVFRCVPEHGDANEFNRRLCDALRADGGVFMSSTTLEGRYVLRFAVLAYNTHRDDVDRALELIRRKIAELRAAA